MIHARDVADKSIKGNLSKAINMALNIESDSVRKNTQTFNTNRYKTTAKINDYEILKDRARELKEYAIKNLPTLLSQLEDSVKKNGWLPASNYKRGRLYCSSHLAGPGKVLRLDIIYTLYIFRHINQQYEC